MSIEHSQMLSIAAQYLHGRVFVILCALGNLKQFLNLCSALYACFCFVSLLSYTTFSFSGFRMLEEKEEPGFLTGLKIPAPWAAGKTVETVHPVRDNYKFKETVHIPGARCLYLRFDSRCSSQYDYDKVSRNGLSLLPQLSCFLFSFALAAILD